jgi:hypothetical protein
MEIVGLLAHPQAGMGFAPSEIWAMDFEEIIFWGEQLEKISKKIYGKK